MWALRALQFLCSPVMFSVYYDLTIKSQQNVIFWLRPARQSSIAVQGLFKEKQDHSEKPKKQLAVHLTP